MIYIPEIPLIDFEAQKAAQNHLKQSNGRQGSLGYLEALAVRLATIRGSKGVTFDHKHIVLIGADQNHLAANPAATSAIMEAIVAEISPINALTSQHHATLTLADIGMSQPFQHPSVQSLRIAKCGNMAAGPALVITEVNDAFMVGMNIGSMEISVGMNLMAAGAITSPGGALSAIAVAAVLGQADVESLMPETDPFGSPLTVPAQIELIKHAIDINKPERIDVIDVIRCVGSAEIAALAGLMLVAAAGRVPILIDGLISAAAAYTAASLNPAIRFSLIAGTAPVHLAHTFILQKLGLRPLVNLDISSESAVGAAMAFPIIDTAAALLTNKISVEDNV
ncbi:MAG: nicotinate-nucleotide--dimethylbenzimidazole phosphoribosyltransferase [Anaerolineae bacterium]